VTLLCPRSALLTEIYLGTYNFGTIDSSKYTGAITYVNVDASRGHWNVTGSGYAVGNGSFVSNSISVMCVCISGYSFHCLFLLYIIRPDTGTTIILLPDAVVTAYYAQVSGAS
jgi:hypothetical protein